MAAIDALAIRTRVAEQLQGQTFPTLIDGFALDMDTRGFIATSRSRSAASVFGADKFRNAMELAETFYLSPEMHEVCLDASQDFPEDEVIMRHDPPSPAGFMHLPGRLRIVELRGRMLVVHAVVWLNNRIWFLCDRDDPEDEINQLMRSDPILGKRYNQDPRYQLSFVLEFDWDKPLPKMMTFERGILPPAAKVNFQVGPDGRQMMFTDALVHPAMSAPKMTTSPELRFLLTVWRIMQQTLLSTVERERPNNKGILRYAQKAGILDPGITVISLRRYESHATGTGTKLDHRVPVRGHWAKRWCGPHGAQYIKHVWIPAHWRGPVDGPILVRERINALIR